MPKLKLVTIEDCDDWNYLIRRTLQKEDVFEVKASYKCGDDFFDQYVNVKPVDFVLLDISLPQTSGIDVAKRIKKEYSELPIIVFTSSKNRSDRVAFSDLNVNGYVSKLRLAFLNDDLKILMGIKHSKTKMRLMPIPSYHLHLIDLVCSGRTNEEIASKLNISSKNVEYRLKKLCDCYQLENSKIALVDFARSYDIL